MADRPNQHTSDLEPQVPARLASDLADLYRAEAVPSAIDAAVLRSAHARFARRRRIRRLVLTAGPLAAAAGLALAVWLFQFQQPVRPSLGAPKALRGDLNADGRVDIVDALLLATALRDDGERLPGWDLTGDGAVTQADVDAIANAAVRLVAANADSQEGAL